MKLTAALVATMSMSWTACAVDTAEQDPGPATSGHIASNTTWTERTNVAGTLTVDPGVTLTVAAGTTVTFETRGGIAVSGTLVVQGTQASKVEFRPATPGEFWNTISVPSQGVVTANYLVQTGGVIAISGGKVTLVDSQLALARGDLLTMNGGTLDMSYSQIGLEPGQRDTTHCDLHVDNAPTIKITHSNISTSSYGIMFYGGNNATFTYTNWFDNSIDVEATPGVVSGDFSHSYFAKGAPTGVGIIATDMQTARLTNAGVGAPR